MTLCRLEAKARSGHEVLQILRAVLEALDHEERDAKRQRVAVGERDHEQRARARAADV